jgi:hypothetical protein
MKETEYEKLLKEAINATGLTLRRISYKFDEIGANIDPTYL